MFGFPSLSKLLLLVAIISAIWFGFRLLSQLDRQRRDVARRKKDRDGGKPRQVDDMVKCSVCGAFTARASKSCGRSGCPF